MYVLEVKCNENAEWSLLFSTPFNASKTSFSINQQLYYSRVQLLTGNCDQHVDCG